MNTTCKDNQINSKTINFNGDIPKNIKKEIVGRRKPARSTNRGIVTRAEGVQIASHFWAHS
jgi:hypothetical protein